MKIGLMRARDMAKEEGDHYYPLGLGYLAAYIEKALPESECKIVSVPGDLLAFRPDLVGISSTSTAFESAKKIAADIKSALDIPVVVGGYHITALPEHLPEVFDAGIIGEGEHTIVELIDACKESSGLSKLDCIDGIVFHDQNRRPKITAPRRQVADIDTLPYPKRNIAQTNRIDVPMFTSRGCPYKCFFCASTKHWGRFRQFSADYVAQEITYLVEQHQAQSILFHDDLFIADRKRFERIASAVIGRGLHRRVSFHGFVRSNLINDGICELLKEMGFTSIRFGAETGSERLLSLLKMGSVSVADHQSAIDTCARHDLPVGGSFVFGTPSETLEDIEETRRFLRKNQDRFKIMGFYVLSPIPGTGLWQWAKQKGFVDDDMDWHKLNQDPRRDAFDWDNMIYMNDDNIPKAQFIDLIDDIMAEFKVASKSLC